MRNIIHLFRENKFRFECNANNIEDICICEKLKKGKEIRRKPDKLNITIFILGYSMSPTSYISSSQSTQKNNFSLPPYSSLTLKVGLNNTIIL